MRTSRVVLALLGALWLAGCNDGRPELADVGGTVLFRGEPLKKGTIIFAVPGQRQATGTIIDGKITTVTTYEPDDGAPVGAAQVAIFANAAADWQPPSQPAASPAEWTATSTPPMVTASLIPERYNDPTTSDLRCEIQRGANALEFVLTE